MNCFVFVKESVTCSQSEVFRLISGLHVMYTPALCSQWRPDILHILCVSRLIVSIVSHTADMSPCHSRQSIDVIKAHVCACGNAAVLLPHYFMSQTCSYYWCYHHVRLLSPRPQSCFCLSVSPAHITSHLNVKTNSHDVHHSHKLNPDFEPFPCFQCVSTYEQFRGCDVSMKCLCVGAKLQVQTFPV